MMWYSPTHRFIRMSTPPSLRASAMPMMWSHQLQKKLLRYSDTHSFIIMNDPPDSFRRPHATLSITRGLGRKCILCIALYSITLHITLYFISFHCTALYSIKLCCIVTLHRMQQWNPDYSAWAGEKMFLLHYFALQSTAIYGIEMHCNVLCWTWSYSVALNCISLHTFAKWNKALSFRDMIALSPSQAFELDTACSNIFKYVHIQICFTNTNENTNTNEKNTNTTSVPGSDKNQ